jgi:hypothetical protein
VRVGGELTPPNPSNTSVARTEGQTRDAAMWALFFVQGHFRPPRAKPHVTTRDFLSHASSRSVSRSVGRRHRAPMRVHRRATLFVAALAPRRRVDARRCTRRARAHALDTQP